jgi:hypothetical protein
MAVLICSAKESREIVNNLPPVNFNGFWALKMIKIKFRFSAFDLLLYQSKFEISSAIV